MMALREALMTAEKSGVRAHTAARATTVATVDMETHRGGWGIGDDTAGGGN